jgi:hypothetical protein
MILSFSQSSGEIKNEDGTIVAMGWAGHGQAKLNPFMENERSLGPLPKGLYRVGEWQDHPRLGPMCAPLEQIEGETFGRDDFWIHGPSRNPEKYGQESNGCIVIPRAQREVIHTLHPDFIRVVA